MTGNIDFFKEVIVLPSSEQKHHIGQKGVVIGICEEDGIIEAYAVLLDNTKDMGFFTEEELSPTGKQFKREDFYR